MRSPSPESRVQRGLLLSFVIPRYKDGSHGNRPPSSQGTNKDYLRVEDEKMAEWRNVNGMWTKDNSAVREAAQNYWTAPGSSTEGR